MIKFKESSELDYTIFEPCNKENEVKLEGLIMVKNQENYILDTLNSIVNICDTITVVDTGSTDSTVSNVMKYYPNVQIKFLEWEENYAKMRNKCLKFISVGSWVLFIDSDETIDTNLTYDVIHNFLNYIDELYPSKDKICTVKQRHIGRPAFFHIERFVKKTDTLYYAGYVHEEPRSSSEYGMIKLNTDIDLINQGLTNQEIAKFSKETRYCNLLLKNIEKEPDNPRWVSLISPTMIEQNYISKTDYMLLLKKHILKNVCGEISKNNLKNGPYLSYLLERYCVSLIKWDDRKAIPYIQLSKELFPYDINFIVFEMTLFLKNIEHELSQKLKEIINYAEETDKERIHEDSEGTEEALTGIVVRLLCKLGQYEQARKINGIISDELVQKMLTNENKILK